MAKLTNKMTGKDNNGTFTVWRNGQEVVFEETARTPDK